MLFRQDKKTETKTPQVKVWAYKYAIQFSILPEITYLNDQHLKTYFLDHLQEIPSDVWLSCLNCEEGIDFCTFSFWVFATHSDKIKEFSIWFYSFFRNANISEELEAFVLSQLDNSEDLTVILIDWSKIQVSRDDTEKIIKQEIKQRPDILKQIKIDKLQ